MRIAILGGNRFVGRRVALGLIEAGEEVTLVHRSAPSVPGASTIRGDRDHPAVIAAALATRPDAILDMCLYRAASAKTVVEAIGGRDVRYVGVSSAAIYSQGSPAPWTEESPIEPASGWGEYGAGKAASDAIVHAAGLADALLVRPPYVIGQGDPDRRCELVFERLEREVPILVPGDGSALIEILDADDLAAILIDLLKGPATGIVNVPGAEPLTVRGFLELCASLSGREPELRRTDARSLEYAPERWPFPNLPLTVSGQRFRQSCRLRPRPVADAVRQAMAR